MRNQERKIELQKKVHSRICIRDITFLAAHPPSYVISCRFLRLLHFYVEKIFFAPENGGGLTSSPPSAYSPVLFINFSFIVKKYKRLKKIISIYLSLLSH